MTPLRADEDPLDMVLEMVQPDAYGVLAGWQVCCRLLKDAARRAQYRIDLLEQENQTLHALIRNLEASQRQSEGEK